MNVNCRWGKLNRFVSVAVLCGILCLVMIVGVTACTPAVPIAPPVTPASPAPTGTSATETPAPDAAAAPQAGKLVFSDNFANPGSGWDTFADANGEAKYENGAYILKCLKYGWYVHTSNKNIPLLSKVAIDLDMTMVNGKDDDRFGIMIGWPDFNPMKIPGIDRPSNFYFIISPGYKTAQAYALQPDLEYSGRAPGYFLREKQFTFINDIGVVNNMKILVNPGVGFLVNNALLVNTTDGNLDLVNRLIKEQKIGGAYISIFALSNDIYPTSTFRLSNIKVYSND